MFFNYITKKKKQNVYYYTNYKNVEEKLCLKEGYKKAWICKKLYELSILMPILMVKKNLI